MWPYPVSQQTRLWMPLTKKGRNTEEHGCACKEQDAGCLPNSSPNDAPALVRRYRMRSKGAEADLYEDALPFSL